MPTYITLGRWTQQGIEKIRESPARLEAFKQLVKSAGGEVKAFYMVTGRYDILAVTEAPSDDVMAKVVLARASKGWIRTETLVHLQKTNIGRSSQLCREQVRASDAPPCCT